MHALFVKMRVKPEGLDALWDAVTDVARRVRDEPGYIAFEPFRPADGSPVVMIFEKWADRAALETHEALSYMKELYGRLGSLLDGAPDLTEMTAVSS
jgi:quinol monooxygenase YgiN